MMRGSIILILITILSFDGLSQINDTLPKQDSLVDKTVLNRLTEFGENVLDLVTLEKPRYTFAVFPVVGYSKRTQIEFGVMPVFRFKSHNSKTKFHRPTIVSPKILLSTSGMFEVDIDATGVSSKNIWYSIKNQYLYLPDLFYGINNTKNDTALFGYDVYSFLLKGDILKGLSTKTFIGISTDFEYTQNRQVEEFFFDDAVPGYKGGWTNGLGPAFIYDSRDNITYPSKGEFLKSSLVFYKSIFGSKYDFNVFDLDIRKYISLSSNDKDIIACQYYMNLIDGDAPFYKLSKLGGKSAVRGIAHSQKYISQNMWMFQTEYRRELWWRIGVVGFAGVGNNFEDYESAFKNNHVFGGVGGRFRALPDEKLNLRIDLGLTNKGDKGLYFTIKEAF